MLESGRANEIAGEVVRKGGGMGKCFEGSRVDIGLEN